MTTERRENGCGLRGVEINCVFVATVREKFAEANLYAVLSFTAVES